MRHPAALWGIGWCMYGAGIWQNDFRAKLFNAKYDTDCASKKGS